MLIRFNRPESMNALGGTLLPELVSALRDAKADDRVRAVVVAGEGRGWCAGADLTAMGRGGAGAPDERHDRRYQALNAIGAVGDAVLAIYNCDKPTIAAVNGVAAGGGFGLCSAFDLRIASEEARFTTIFIKRALAADCGLSWFLPRLVGPERAAEMFYTGRIVNAAEAKEIGLVSKVVPHAQLMDEAMGFARQLAKHPPTALTYTRRALHFSMSNTLEQQLDYEWTTQTRCLASEEFKEGIKAFIEKREPDYSNH
jgi:2-(1,2-epoxy-1,2-dihydrophenyl)acetyl-CoA isomerase